MPYEDFTTYTEVDPNNHITIASATHIDADLYMNEDAHVYKDAGVGHFGNFEHKEDGQFVAYSAEGVYREGNIWFLANEINDGKYFDDNLLNYLQLAFGRTAANASFLGLGARDGSNKYTDTYAPSTGVWYYNTIQRSGTTLTCKIYSDSARTNLLDTLSVTCPTTTFRYIYASNTRNAAAARYVTVDVENLDLQEVIEKIVSDSAVGVESLLKLRNLATIADSGVCAEVVSRSQREMILTDLGAGAESVDKLRNVALIYDSGVGTEIVSRPQREMTLLDTATGGEVVTRPYREMTVTDLANCLEILFKLRELGVVTDGAVGLELVTVGVAGVIKTKVFLILGPLAIQLTGD